MHDNIRFSGSLTNNVSTKRGKPMAAQGSSSTPPSSSEHKRTFRLLFPEQSDAKYVVGRSSSKKLQKKLRKSVIDDDVFADPRYHARVSSPVNHNAGGYESDEELGIRYPMDEQAGSVLDTPSPIRFFSSSSRSRAKLRKKSLRRCAHTPRLEATGSEAPVDADEGEAQHIPTLKLEDADTESSFWSLSNLIASTSETFNQAFRGRSLTKKDIRSGHSLKKRHQGSGVKETTVPSDSVDGPALSDGHTAPRRRSTLRKRPRISASKGGEERGEERPSKDALAEEGPVLSVKADIYLPVTPRSPQKASSLDSTPSIVWDESMAHPEEPTRSEIDDRPRKSKFPTFLSLAYIKFRGMARQRSRAFEKKPVADIKEDQLEEDSITDSQDYNPTKSTSRISRNESDSPSVHKSSCSSSQYSTASSNTASIVASESASSVSQDSFVQGPYVSRADKYTAALSRGVVYGDFCTPLYIPLTCLLGFPCPPSLTRRMYSDRWRWACVFALGLVSFIFIALSLAGDILGQLAIGDSPVRNAIFNFLSDICGSLRSTTATSSKLRIAVIVCVLTFVNFLCFVFSTQLDWAYQRRMTAVLFPFRLLFV